MLTSRLRYLGLGLLAGCLTLLLSSGLIPAIALPKPAKPVAATEVSVPLVDWSQGRQYYVAGRFADAAQVWQRLANAYGQRGDRANQALSLSYLSLAYQRLNQWDLAQRASDASLQTLAAAATPEAILWAQALNTQASLLLHNGQTETALDTWQQAEDYYQQAGDTQGVLGTQLNQAQALHSLGYYGRASQLLKGVGTALYNSEDSLLKVQTLHSLGSTFRTSGDFQLSYDVLRQAIELAERLELKNELSPILLSLGNTASDQKKWSDALYYFTQAEQQATTPEARLDAQLNQLRLYAQQQQIPQVQGLAPQIREQLSQLPPSRATIYGAINLADTLAQLPQPDQMLPPRTVAQLLADAIAASRRLQDPTAEAYALAQLGQLYVRQGQLNDGVALLQQSLSIGQALQANTIISQSAWTLGRALTQNNRANAAIAAYQNAITALQALRGDLVGVNQDVQFSFRESVEPIYRELVGLILDNNPDQAALAHVRELIEALQLAELDDFFRDACLDTQPRQIDEIDPNAAVLYSILLPDRLAVVVSAANQPLSYYTVPVSQQEAEQTVREFLAKLHPVSNNAEQLRLSQTLYDWLIRPAEAAQALHGRETLVFVLDGLLQRVPMASLHDGQHYLVENYAIALSPGLNLLDAQPLEQQTIQAIVGGMSAARPGFAALPEVENEVQNISQTVSAASLLNESFTQENLANKLLRWKNTNVLHLATHGQFGSTQENTFLLTWDGTLTVRELSELLRQREANRANTLELLVLSACDTAAGDDRAVLGLAGFAVKSGARSTVASLWPVKDKVAAQMMTQFYERLSQPGITKAEALRQAQRSLLIDKGFQDPFFWSSFVIVGNWL
ncbi:MAG: CHAT domain-containing protein [Cyanobacteria bacterium P01_G01_bin.54]